MKEKIMKWYPVAWTVDMVRNAVVKGVISEQDFEEITGQTY